MSLTPLKRPLSSALFIVAAMVLIPENSYAAEDKPGIISVSATGKSSIKPDMAIINLSVVRESETARAALDENNAAMAAVLAAMKEAKIEDRDLQTSNFSIQPRYFYPKQSSKGPQKPPQITGYVVSNSLTVRLRDLTRLGALIDESVTLGVNSGGAIQFVSSDPSSTIEMARKDAMKNAIAKARTLTQAAGVELGRILTINEGSVRIPRARGLAQARAASSRVESAVPVAGGENSYSISISVSWELNQ